MTDEHGHDCLEQNKEITCLDDVPSIARVAERQQSIVKWYRLLAIAPFCVVVFISLKFFPQSRSWLIVGPGLASLLWAMVVAGYAFYCTFWGVKCPSCGSSFGSLRDRCRSCDLPRHLKTPQLFSSTIQE
jgi:hypothetical protein